MRAHCGINVERRHVCCVWASEIVDAIIGNVCVIADFWCFDTAIYESRSHHRKSRAEFDLHYQYIIIIIIIIGTSKRSEQPWKLIYTLRSVCVFCFYHMLLIVNDTEQTDRRTDTHKWYYVVVNVKFTAEERENKKWSTRNEPIILAIKCCAA